MSAQQCSPCTKHEFPLCMLYLTLLSRGVATGGVWRIRAPPGSPNALLGTPTFRRISTLALWCQPSQTWHGLPHTPHFTSHAPRSVFGGDAPAVISHSNTPLRILHLSAGQGSQFLVQSMRHRMHLTKVNTVNCESRQVRFPLTSTHVRIERSPFKEFFIMQRTQ